MIIRSPRPSIAAAGVAAALLVAVAPARAQQTAAPGRALAPLQVVTPAPFDRAVENGTRTRTGAPGPSYWQNSADYDIHATVTPKDSLLSGEETVTYHNASRDSLTSVRFHVYQNLMAGFGAHERPTPAMSEGIVIDALESGGRTIPVKATFFGGPDSTAAQVYGTLMRVPMRPAIPPGATITFHVKWHFRIPQEFAPRMGMQDSTTAQIAQWYPKIAVYDDVHGWDDEQYSGTGEFYEDYGHYRYDVTLPAGFVVGGSGTLTNAAEVLTDAERAALDRARSGDEVVHVLTAADFGPGTATRGAAGQTLTWKFDADSVRDVAFSFSDHYLWDATHAVVDSAKGRKAMVHALYRPNPKLFDRVAAMARAALETHSRRVAPYPWPQLTQTEGGSGGMEYPMTVFVDDYDDLYVMEMVTAHEIGHEWFPMLVGSNETRYGWQDEGLNTFDTFFATDDFLPDSFRGHGVEESRSGYLRFVDQADEDLQMMSPANAFGVTDAGYGVEAYDKPSTALWVLYRTLGEDVFYRAYREYVRRWSYRHPTPWDFFHTFDDVTGRDLDPFFYQWFFTRDKLDQGIASVERHGDTLSVTVRNDGRIYAPVWLAARLADGSEVEWSEPMTAWYDGRGQLVSEHAVSGVVTGVVLDPHHDLPDVDRDDNEWRP